VEHREIREYLPAYVDEAKGPRASAVEEHLQTCEECRADLERYRQIMSGLESLETLTQDPPPWLYGSIIDAVRSRARQAITRKSQLNRLRNPRVAAAGAVVAAGVAGAVAVRLMKRRRRRSAWQRLRASLAGA
jgi:anti-sigma factor RsiW